MESVHDMLQWLSPHIHPVRNTIDLFIDLTATVSKIRGESVHREQDNERGDIPNHSDIVATYNI